MSPYLHAIIASVSRSSNDIVYRRGMLADADPLATAIFNSFFGGAIIMIFTGLPSLHDVGAPAVLCLLLANLCWAGQTLFYLKSLQNLDAGVTALMDCLRYVVLVLAGAFLFFEPTSFAQWLGVLIIAISILFGADVFHEHQRRGVLFSLGGVCFGSAALMLDKHLTSALDNNLVILAGFFLPGILYSLYAPRSLAALPGAIRKHTSMMVLSSAFIAITGCNLIYAFGSGHLGTTMTIYQSSVVLTFVLGVLVLNERAHLVRRSVAALLCLAGIAIISFF